MKLLIFIITFTISVSGFSQGTLYVQNYSNYELEGRLGARGKQNCFPSAIASYTFPAMTSININTYNNSLPYIDSWSVRLSYTGTSIPQNPPSSGLLTTISPLTQWQFTWFMTVDANGNQTGDQFWMGDDAFSSVCSTSPVYDYQHGNNGNTDAYWFYLPSTNETYLVVQ